MLLWHGTHLSNYLSILKSGLILQSDVLPGTVVTSRMFGIGIYGANSVSKSFNYANTNKQNPVSCIILAEFALGNISMRNKDDHYITEKNLHKAGYNSVQGCGQHIPSTHITKNNVIIPQGKLHKSTLLGTDPKNYPLVYDEFVIYNENQINLKYIVEIKALYNS